MTTITLTPEIEEPLAEEARRQGTTPELLALDSLRARFVPLSTLASEGDTLFDFLQGYVGTVEGTSEPLSEDTGRRFTEGLLEKQRAGKL